MNKTGWKAMAIVFIILFTLGTLFIIWAWDYGTNLVEKENECVYNICNSEDYDAYIFDDIESICYCYKNNEIVYQEYIR